MADQYEHLDLKRYLPHAILTTLAVISIPIVIVIGLILIADPNPPLFVTTSVAVVVAMLTIAVGSALWLRRPESSEISFGDLMIWGWWRRKRAEDRLAKGTRLLGLDRSGRPQMHQVVSREQQLHILRELTAALESKDPYTHGHSRRVERHVFRTAIAMGLPSEDVEDLRKAAALHDVGKIRVPDRILRKPEALSADERSVLEDHVVVGAWMVSSAGNADVVSGVRHHHEHWDGSGYPDGLSTTDIPLFSRIIAVGDTFDAITSTRPYRAGADRERAIEVLRTEAGRQFDPAVVEAFINTLPAQVPAGLLALVATPRGLLSKAAVLLKRVGAGALAPAAGATGAVMLVGASTLTPGAIAHDRLPNTPTHIASSATTQNAAPATQGSARDRKFSGGPSRDGARNGRQSRSSLGRSPLGSSPLAGANPPAGTSPDPGAPSPEPSSPGISVHLDGLFLAPTSVQAQVGTDLTVTASATAGGHAVQGATVLYSVDGSNSRTGSCTTDAAGQCAITYAGGIAGTDTITACGDGNANGAVDPDEPCGEATVTWLQPMVAVKANGSGEIANAAGLAKIAFEFSVKGSSKGARGDCELIDSTPAASVTIQCNGVSNVDRNGDHVTFSGNAIIDGVSGTYRISIDDNGTPGKGRDRFDIQTSTGYSAGGLLVSGNIQVHG
jgi:hypothetical protein